MATKAPTKLGARCWNILGPPVHGNYHMNNRRTRLGEVLVGFRVWGKLEVLNPKPSTPPKALKLKPAVPIPAAAAERGGGVQCLGLRI